ncbi:uncharacterized protein [Ptychodera flava]|uniref:uncharacterized protein n=1 Tax=Ptychodera flava TaxID=63121 RepID=UPI00396A3612
MCVAISNPQLYMHFTFFSNKASITLTSDGFVARPGYHASVSERDAILFLFGPPSTDSVVALGSDQGISLTTDSFKYYGLSYNTIVVNEDGVISFNGPLVDAAGFTTTHLQALNTFNEPLISIYQADHSNSKTGEIYFRTMTSTSEPSVMADIDDVINDAFPCRSNSFVGTSAFLLTYWRISFLGAVQDGLRIRNTYQIAVTTRSGGETYAVVNYHDVQWYSGTRDSGGESDTGQGGTPARAGFTDGNGNSYENPLSGLVDIIDIEEASNVDLLGRYVYRIDGQDIEHPTTASPPTITCPPHIIAIDCGSGAQVTWNDPQTSSDCGPITNGPTCSESPGIFSQSTTVTCTVSNRSGTSSCSFLITVMEDTEPPTIASCPQDITLDTTSSDGEIVNYMTPLGTDDCTHDVTCLPESGSLFPCDTTQVTCTAVDENGATTSCSFQVTVNCQPEDTEPPVITNCPSDITVIDSGNNGEQVSWVEPDATDNSGNVYLTSTHQPGATFTAGSTVVVYTASDDAGNNAMCSFTVTVVPDNTPPVITGCPSDISALDRFNPGEAIEWTEPTATDNSGGLVILTSTHQPGDIFHIGSTQVTYTAVDEAGYQAVCTFLVVIERGPLGICRHYFFHSGPETFANAKTSCELAGNELTKVPNGSTNSALVQHIIDQGASSSSYWFGVSKLGGSNWMNADGSSVCYENWNDPAEETDNGQDCAQLWSTVYDQWTSEDCTDTKGYICQSLL